VNVLHGGAKLVLVTLFCASVFVCSTVNAKTLMIRNVKYGAAERESLDNIESRSYSSRDSRGAHAGVSPTGISARRYNIDDRGSLKNFLSLNQNNTGRR